MRTKEAVRQTITQTIAPTTTHTLSSRTPQQLARDFLARVSKRYITAMRNAGRGALYGGDIELEQIASILNVRVIVHKSNGYTPEVAEI